MVKTISLHLDDGIFQRLKLEKESREAIKGDSISWETFLLKPFFDKIFGGGYVKNEELKGGLAKNEN